MQAYKKIVSFVVLISFLALSIVAIANAQDIEDWWKLRGYDPPVAISKLADEDTMTDKGRRYFFASHPELVNDKAQFNTLCPQSEQTIVLGCYYRGENFLKEGIAIYDITDARLAGVEEVTAAHETLHAAYSRLSSGDKEHVNSMLLDYYNNGLSDERVKATIESYKKTEPNDVVNEMHSLFGTEIGQLPQSLEDYYKRYFSNRQAIARFSDQYESVFSQNKTKLDGIKSQIEQLKLALENDKATIENEQNYLQADSRRMQGLLNSGKSTQYNAAVEPYNARVIKLRALIASYNAKVNQINSLVEQYNSLAYTQESLYNSLDTRVQIQTAQ